jgi:hypothetical protein
MGHLVASDGTLLILAGPLDVALAAMIKTCGMEAHLFTHKYLVNLFERLA